MSKHRAGPWHVERIPESAFGKHGITTSVGSNHYCGDYVAVVSADGIIICDNAGYYPEAIDPDDAPVIAAAPELLEALEALMPNKTGYGNSMNWDVYSDAVGKAGAAIAKAKGEQQ